MQQGGAQPDARAACDRLMALCAQALAIEEKQRAVTEDTIRVPLVLYAMAQLRMRLCPALTPGWPSGDPVHSAIVGGTNSGKSTVVNVCLGRAAAGMHVTARFSQHPEAYRPTALGDRWLEDYASRFAGYVRYRDAHPPRQADRELLLQGYRPALAVLDPWRGATTPVPPASATTVLWDTPDFSTDVAQTYFSAVLDVVALADLVILTVTDESYADDRVLALLRLLSEAGVQLYVVVNKLADNPELLADMQAKIDANWRGPSATLPAAQWLRLPRVAGDTPEQRLACLLAQPEAVALRDAVARQVARGPALKRQALAGAVAFLDRRLADVLRLLVAEAEVASTWETTVQRLFQIVYLEPYRQHYLHGQRYGEFNRTLMRVMELLEVPWIGPLVKRLGDVVRLPFRLVRGLVRNLFGAAPALSESAPEQALAAELLTRCLADLKAEAQTLAETTDHPAWPEVVRGLDSQAWHTQIMQRFESAYAVYRQEVEAQVQQRAAAIYQAIAQRPWLLQVLRGANLAVDAAAVVLVIKSGGLDWSDAVVGPLVVSLRRALVEAGLESYLARQEASLKQEQFEAMRALIATHGIAPAGELFVSAVDREAVTAARRDFACVQAAALQVAQQEEGV